MTGGRKHLGLATALVACALLAAGCATTPATPHAPATRAVAATPGLSENERLGLAVALLNHGDRDQARAELGALLAASPGNAQAQRLLKEVDEDPQAALGRRNFPYTTRPGDTMASVAARFLGDPLKFYVLARYNNVATPASLVAGQVLMIPGEPRRTEEPRAPAPASSQPQAAVAHSAPPAQPVAARRLRAVALEDIDRGQINRAVRFLQQAAQLDPDNPQIKRDLARARRIAMTVQGR